MKFEYLLSLSTIDRSQSLSRTDSLGIESNNSTVTGSKVLHIRDWSCSRAGFPGSLTSSPYNSFLSSQTNASAKRGLENFPMSNAISFASFEFFNSLLVTGVGLSKNHIVSSPFVSIVPNHDGSTELKKKAIFSCNALSFPHILLISSSRFAISFSYKNAWLCILINCAHSKYNPGCSILSSIRKKSVGKWISSEPYRTNSAE